MLTHHSTLNVIQRIDFQPDTFAPRDLLWLPHHSELARSGRKRQTEHLAGRIAAVHALRAYNEKAIPGIGANRQPLWPAGLYGSISHCGRTAVAVVDKTPVGIDIESVFDAALAETLAHQVASHSELSVLRNGPLPFPLALTLAFSAKESLYKALSARHPTLLHFHDAVVSAIDARRITLQIPSLSLAAALDWFAVAPHCVITLLHQPSLSF